MKLNTPQISSWLKRCFVALVTFNCVLSPTQAQIWSEEFNSGSAPDSTVWSYDLGDSGWGNQELQNYTSNAANVRVGSGNLIITAVKQGNSFTSGRIKTLDKLNFTYGTIEARIQVPDLGNGLWPAFWTLGNKYPSVGWPECGEIDVVEMGSASAITAGAVNSRVGSAAHWDKDGDDATVSRSKDLPSDLDGSFHIYRMEWTPTYISTYIDDQWIWSTSIDSASFPSKSGFHEPHFFILNLAVGGTYTGILNANDISAPFPAEYLVDYIRIYDNGYTQLGGSSTETPPTPGTNILSNPGFESGTTDWEISLSGGSAEASTAYAHSGINSLKINSTGAGDWASPHAAQIVPANPGDVFNVQGYMLNPADSPITGSSFGLFKIEFRDSEGTPLQPASVDIGSSAGGPYYGAESIPRLNADSTVDSWIFSEAQAEAPAGTVEVGFVLLNVNQPENLGPMYFDDIQAVLHGDPILPVTLNAMIVEDTIEISFLTQNGVSYEMAYKGSMTNENWTPIETIIGDGNTNSTSYPTSTPARFYGVLTP